AAVGHMTVLDPLATLHRLTADDEHGGVTECDTPDDHAASVDDREFGHLPESFWRARPILQIRSPSSPLAHPAGTYDF
ncbi:MAG TPA: hypothetical protein PLV68_03275, partial [Ilumatobacteraceae bacterium]|nr:hypothetical protein [Ilumatobacteraceae bacterium]